MHITCNSIRGIGQPVGHISHTEKGQDLPCCVAKVLLECSVSHVHFVLLEKLGECSQLWDVRL